MNKVKGILILFTLLLVFGCTNNHKQKQLIRVERIEALNKSVNMNEDIILGIKLYNPGHLKVVSLVINGIEYTNFRSYDHTLFELSVYSGNHEGLKNITIDKVFIDLNGVKTEIKIAHTSSFNIYVFEPVSVLSIETDNAYYGYNDLMTLIITLDKRSHYQIESFMLNGVTYHKGNFVQYKNEILINLNSEKKMGIHHYDLTRVTYSVDHYHKELSIDNTNTSVYIGDTNEIHYIYNGYDLQNLDPNGINILMNDIDLTGFNWEPLVLEQGYFNGNGHKIYNLSIHKEIDCKTNTYWGLFSSSNGLIDDVNLVNVNINVRNKDTGDIYIGDLVGYNAGMINKSNLNSLNEVVGINVGVIKECSN